jgi:hypothetical protein
MRKSREAVFSRLTKRNSPAPSVKQPIRKFFCLTGKIIEDGGRMSSVQLYKETKAELMKIGDKVYLVPNQLTVSSEAAGEVMNLDDSTTELTLRLAKSGAMLKVKTWDVLPAKVYTRAVLYAVFKSVQDLERELGSILKIELSSLTRGLIEHDLSPQAAYRCIDLFDFVEWRTSRFPLRSWLRRIRDYF